MTQQHRDALHKAIHARKTAREAIIDAAKVLADERAAASEREMALRTESHPQQRETKGNG